ncbi:hypothetical protein BDV95DRAFT_496257 [Massariosphaeria phaeospora]|uniref:Uncharacterized protein n=1 Tax=Massariosphaeria phaeospora TaxID=100035 RepID=A0A7C8M7V9_9PLEO|nr:hypothetical protein BDV95DRAFT_496257 [Massariosphaeria phaeospora]
MACIHTENQNQGVFCPFALLEVSVLHESPAAVEVVLLCRCLTTATSRVATRTQLHSFCI